MYAKRLALGTAVAALAGVLAGVGLVAPAGAVFPGANGRSLPRLWGSGV